ncbi:MAG: type IV pilin protein [Candidatus Saccharimonadales bacterium]
MKKTSGFTIVELLIVIVVIGILAAITIVAYNGVQNRAKSASAQQAAANMISKSEAYNADDTTGANGYPLAPSLLTGAASSKTYYLAGVDATTPLVAGTVPAKPATVNFYTCNGTIGVAGAGVKVEYFDYSNPGTLKSVTAGDAGGTCTVSHS